MASLEFFKRAVLIGLAYAAVIVLAGAALGAETVEYRTPMVWSEFQQLSSSGQQAWLEANEIRYTGLSATTRILRDPKQILQLLMVFFGITLVVASACIIMVKSCPTQPRT